MNNWVREAGKWSIRLFGKNNILLTPKVRMLRFIKEAMELAQVEGVTPEEIDILRDQVFNRPVGERSREVGGVLLTFFGYCHTAKVDPTDCFVKEFARVQSPEVMEKIRNRNLSGDKIGIQTKS